MIIRTEISDVNLSAFMYVLFYVDFSLIIRSKYYSFVPTTEEKSSLVNVMSFFITNIVRAHSVKCV